MAELIASAAPVPRWVWWQLGVQMCVSFVLSFPVPFVAMGFTLATTVEVIWAASRFRRWQVFVVQQRELVRAEVVGVRVLSSGRRELPAADGMMRR